MKRFLISALAACCLIGAAQSAFGAEDLKPLPPPSAHQMDLANQILDASGMRTTMAPQLHQLIVQMMTGAMGAKTPEEQRIVERAVNMVMPKLLSRVTTVYAQVYNEQELTDILTFYHSAGGKALLAKQPEFLSRCEQAGEGMGPDFEAALKAAVKESQL